MNFKVEALETIAAPQSLAYKIGYAIGWLVGKIFG